MTESVSEEKKLEKYLHDHIPISAAMGVEVRQAREEAVILRAPLDLNINHRHTVFGGSAAAVAILAGWSLLHVRLPSTRGESRIVIQRTSVEYIDPINQDFDAVAIPPDDKAWAKFNRSLDRKGLGRIEVDVELRAREKVVGRCRGAYVVLPSEG